MKVRDLDYSLTVATDDEPDRTDAVADGRELDGVAAGGFLGLWLGIYGTSSGAVSTTDVEVDRVEYLPV